MCPTQSDPKQTEKPMFGAEKGLLRGHARRQVAHALKSPELAKGVWQSTFKSQVEGVWSQGMWSAYAQISDSLMVAQRVKHLPAMQETWVQSLGQEDPLEKEMAIHSRTLAWKIPWTEKLGRL